MIDYNLLQTMELNQIRRGQSIDALKLFPFFEEFVELLGNHQRLIFQNQVQHLFYCFCISKKIQLIMEEQKTMKFIRSQISLESFEQAILLDPTLSACLQILMKRSKKHQGLKQQKDRKTSFFRTILKHLKAQNQQKKSESNEELLKNLQKKLSKNTISSDDIRELTSQFGSQIYEYLRSPKIYKDILFNNKSQANKSFYILHLGEISLASTVGKLQNFSFFVRQDLQQEIKRIIKSYYEDFIGKNNDQIVSNTNESEEADIFSVLNLGKFSTEKFPSYINSNAIFDDEEYFQILEGPRKNSSEKQMSFEHTFF